MLTNCGLTWMAKYKPSEIQPRQKSPNNVSDFKDLGIHEFIKKCEDTNIIHLGL